MRRNFGKKDRYRFCNGYNRKQCYKKIRRLSGKQAKELSKLDFLEAEGGAFFINFTDQNCLIYVDKECAGNLAAIAHEIFHAVYYIMKESGVKLSEDSEEAFAYLTEYLMKQIIEHLK